MTTEPLSRPAAERPWPATPTGVQAPVDQQAAAPPADATSPELVTLVRSLLQTCAELRQRVDDLELTERLRARRSPPHSLGIDY
ncbi:hypothetical protein [Deinococcus koreensis]|uniref:Uncharacterized protein n=1 Tax=Deinococcus koreensis TaxID=2054903 RepID=A0A2K3UST4_9DEIO|nr:hypothetical protein [Deinococcus koreensis]PNY79570.1 hypothetical protein CVO96_19290 [Deinococcus koreensis]